MKKEILMILLILALPTIFVMSMQPRQTGALVNGIAMLRTERIYIYIGFPIPPRPLKVIGERARQGILVGAHEDFYTSNGLENGHRFFDNELETYQALLMLMCLKPTGIISEGRFISPGGISITTTGEITDIGQIPCEEELRIKAEQTLIALVDIDSRLVELTVQNSRCPDIAADSLYRAEMNIIEGNYEAVLTNLRVAWSKVTSCI